MNQTVKSSFVAHILISDTARDKSGCFRKINKVFVPHCFYSFFFFFFTSENWVIDFNKKIYLCEFVQYKDNLNH